MQCACAMFSSVACPAVPYFSTLSDKRNDCGINLTGRKKCFDFLYNSFPKTFLILRSIHLDRVINVYIIKRTKKMQLCQYCLLVTARSLYKFRTLSAYCTSAVGNRPLDILTGYISPRPITCTNGCYYSF